METAKTLTEAQLESNRLNAQKSTGPKTPEGKKRSKLNATRHGLTGLVFCLPEEDGFAFHKHYTGILADLNPQGPLETELAQGIADDYWRLKRARAVENNIFGLGHDRLGGPDADHAQINTAFDQARTWLRDSKDIQLIALYEQRIHRSIARATKELEALQIKRKAAREVAFEDAKDLSMLNIMEGKPIDPADLCLTPGFVFSVAEIERHVALKDRRKKADHFKFFGWDAKKTFKAPLITMPTAA